jgi:predicted porin
MKKTILAIVSLAAMTSVAHAQSSVTLYGALDTSIAYFGNQQGANRSGGTFQLAAGNLSPNLWGLKGTEDLGGGLSAIFKLESGFNVFLAVPRWSACRATARARSALVVSTIR